MNDTNNNLLLEELKRAKRIEEETKRPLLEILKLNDNKSILIKNILYLDWEKVIGRRDE